MTKTVQVRFNDNDLEKTKISSNLCLIHISTEFDCPGDGTCSNQGICDDTVGTCQCDLGFVGNTCQGN